MAGGTRQNRGLLAEVEGLRFSSHHEYRGADRSGCLPVIVDCSQPP